jgi:Homing endonuclease associated repeat
MTREDVVAAIVECTEQLGHVPSRNELRKHGHVSREHLRRHFGTYTRALEECNLKRRAVGGKLEMEALFLDWGGVVRALKKLPTVHEYEDGSKFSQRPLLTRFGTWAQVPAGLKQYAEDHDLADDWRDVLEIVEAQDRAGRERALALTAGWTKEGRVLTDRPMYGALMRPCPLICEPTNEACVVYLFGTVAERLGFMVMRIQSEFPDCEALRLVEEDRLQKVRIEFEYESRNFLRHLHNARECDLIVCWKHTWPECPLEVLELREVVRRLGERA